ncbi:hypothetical protein B0H19DRAFT_1258111 [Mycena capillaripes]|nr:hypothetical protein B0H19DRAFT_1258111 [Mycena capillaripes]
MSVVDIPLDVLMEISRELDLSDRAAARCRRDWDSIIFVTGWLKSFRTTTTTLMFTTKRPVLSSTHTIFRGLQEDLRTSIKDLGPPNLDAFGNSKRTTRRTSQAQRILLQDRSVSVLYVGGV